ncbi:hypothetical protein IWW50_005725, partial [Coemansia erecta]
RPKVDGPVGEWDKSGGSVSPELVSNGRRLGGHDEGMSDGESEGEYFSVDYPSYSLGRARNTRTGRRVWSQGSSTIDGDTALLSADQDQYESSDSVDDQFELPDSVDTGQDQYESSDSVDAGGDLPLDTYFASSIENYLERLRQQLSVPDPESPDEHDAFSGSSSSSSLDLQTHSIFNSPFNGPKSSPRTMSSSSLSDFADQHYKAHSAISRSHSASAAIYDEYVSESSSPAISEPVLAYEIANNENQSQKEEDGVIDGYDIGMPQLMMPYGDARQPVLYKPRLVSPRVFFDCDSAPPPNNYTYTHNIVDIDYDDDNASIHSGESIHSDQQEHLDDDANCTAYDLQVTDSSYYLQ